MPWGIGAESTITLDVPAPIRRIAEDDLEYDDRQPIKGIRADLNGDGVDDFLLQSASRLCGNGGCVYVLCDGATRKKLGLFFGSVVYVYAERTHVVHPMDPGRAGPLLTRADLDRHFRGADGVLG